MLVVDEIDQVQSTSLSTLEPPTGVSGSYSSLEPYSLILSTSAVRIPLALDANTAPLPRPSERALKSLLHHRSSKDLSQFVGAVFDRVVVREFVGKVLWKIRNEHAPQEIRDFVHLCVRRVRVANMLDEWASLVVENQDLECQVKEELEELSTKKRALRRRIRTLQVGKRAFAEEKSSLLHSRSQLREEVLSVRAERDLVLEDLQKKKETLRRVSSDHAVTLLDLARKRKRQKDLRWERASLRTSFEGYDERVSRLRAQISHCMKEMSRHSEEVNRKFGSFLYWRGLAPPSRSRGAGRLSLSRCSSVPPNLMQRSDPFGFAGLAKERERAKLREFESLSFWSLSPKLEIEEEGEKEEEEQEEQEKPSEESLRSVCAKKKRAIRQLSWTATPTGSPSSMSIDELRRRVLLKQIRLFDVSSLQNQVSVSGGDPTIRRCLSCSSMIKSQKRRRGGEEEGGSASDVVESPPGGEIADAFAAEVRSAGGELEKEVICPQSPRRLEYESLSHVIGDADDGAEETLTLSSTLPTMDSEHSADLSSALSEQRSDQRKLAEPLMMMVDEEGFEADVDSLGPSVIGMSSDERLTDSDIVIEFLSPADMPEVLTESDLEAEEDPDDDAFSVVEISVTHQHQQKPSNPLFTSEDRRLLEEFLSSASSEEDSSSGVDEDLFEEADYAALETFLDDDEEAVPEEKQRLGELLLELCSVEDNGQKVSGVLSEALSRSSLPLTPFSAVVGQHARDGDVPAAVVNASSTSTMMTPPFIDDDVRDRLLDAFEPDEPEESKLTDGENDDDDVVGEEVEVLEFKSINDDDDDDPSSIGVSVAAVPLLKAATFGENDSDESKDDDGGDYEDDEINGGGVLLEKEKEDPDPSSDAPDAFLLSSSDSPPPSCVSVRSFAIFPTSKSESESLKLSKNDDDVDPTEHYSPHSPHEDVVVIHSEEHWKASSIPMPVETTEESEKETEESQPEESPTSESLSLRSPLLRAASQEAIDWFNDILSQTGGGGGISPARISCPEVTWRPRKISPLVTMTVTPPSSEESSLDIDMSTTEEEEEEEQKKTKEKSLEQQQPSASSSVNGRLCLGLTVDPLPRSKLGRGRGWRRKRRRSGKSPIVHHRGASARSPRGRRGKGSGGGGSRRRRRRRKRKRGGGGQKRGSLLSTSPIVSCRRGQRTPDVELEFDMEAETELSPVELSPKTVVVSDDFDASADEDEDIDMEDDVQVSVPHSNLLPIPPPPTRAPPSPPTSEEKHVSEAAVSASALRRRPMNSTHLRIAERSEMPWRATKREEEEEGRSALSLHSSVERSFPSDVTSAVSLADALRGGDVRSSVMDGDELVSSSVCLATATSTPETQAAAATVVDVVGVDRIEKMEVSSDSSSSVDSGSPLPSDDAQWVGSSFRGRELLPVEDEAEMIRPLVSDSHREDEEEDFDFDSTTTGLVDVLQFEEEMVVHPEEEEKEDGDSSDLNAYHHREDDRQKKLKTLSVAELVIALGRLDAQRVMNRSVLRKVPVPRYVLPKVSRRSSALSRNAKQVLLVGPDVDAAKGALVRSKEGFDPLPVGFRRRKKKKGGPIFSSLVFHMCRDRKVVVDVYTGDVFSVMSQELFYLCQTAYDLVCLVSFEESERRTWVRMLGNVAQEKLVQVLMMEKKGRGSEMTSGKFCPLADLYSRIKTIC